MIFRAQRYEKGRVISLRDMEEAKNFLLVTYEDSYTTLEDAAAPRDFNKWLNRVVEKIKEEGGKIHRTKLLRQMSPYGCLKRDVDLLLRQLFEEGRIFIKSESGKLLQSPTKNGTEIYEWKTGLGANL